MKRVREFLHRNGITVRIVACFLLLVIIPYIALAVCVYLFVSGSFINSLGQTNMDTLTVSAGSIHTALNELEDDSMSVYYTECVTMLEQEESLSTEEAAQIEDVLSAVCYSNTGVLSAYLESDKGSFHSGGNYPELIDIMQPHIDEIVAAQGKCIWYPSCDLHGRATESNFILARSLNGAKQKNIGILFLVVSDKMITDALGQLSTAYATWYLTDESGTIFYCSDDTLVGSKRDVSMLSPMIKCSFQTVKNAQDEQVIVASRTLMDVKWYCISEIELLSMTRYVQNLALPLLLISLVYFFFLLLMLYFMRRYVLFPLRTLKSSMDQYAQNDLNETQISIVGIGEFESLSTHFNNMTQRISSLMTAYKREEEEKNRQKMNALTAQLTPHFIYNALNTIKWVAVLNHQEKIQQLVESLVGIFMNALRVEDGSYTLRDELELIENYAVIQKVRFVNFELSTEIGENCLNCCIRKLLLQPIVENAIVHGLKRGKVKDGAVLIQAWREGDALRIIVSDNGTGFDLNRWRSNPKKKKEHTNIGIHNVEEIISLEYGEPYCMTIHSVIGTGTTVHYTLPAREKRGAETKHDSDDYRR